MRIFVCLISQPGSAELNAIAVAAADREAAVASCQPAAAKQSHDAVVVGALTQEDVTSLGMLLAAGREAFAATTQITV